MFHSVGPINLHGMMLEHKDSFTKLHDMANILCEMVASGLAMKDNIKRPNSILVAKCQESQLPRDSS
jgi:hypothetical protein